MNFWSWLGLIMLTLITGCAPGYSAKGPAYEPSGPAMSGMTFENPETPAEAAQRIWSESAGR